MAAPQKIKLHRQSKTLELNYIDGSYMLSAEFLRVHSPSAEVKGHGGVGGQFVSAKQGVGIEGLEAQGRYAVKIIFSDGHDTGIYTWDYLRELAANYEDLWRLYLEELNKRGLSRDPHETAVKLFSGAEPGQDNLNA